MPECFSCGSSFADNGELALHISTSKDKKHRNRKSKVWAANYLMRTRTLNAKKDLPTRSRMSEDDKEAKHSTYRDLSGQNEIVDTICPRCLTKGRAALEVEHTQEEKAWKIRGRFAVYCNNCRE